ncbi:FecR family protein [Zobellia galactanivorans]|uniref:Anti-sigma factor n=1 Tax=Zobellia galactanivorans (strain DSM 12802 / CCUG 47099 / CIP 106680 / NCIMB 13871 / Dsij) TaxID=63186 RepID=G0L7K5_ZOBGA|nr:FecR domain-containing protein [Zobellia galactanivorans]CAZ98123.1 Anti-sigma factor [Zobellia galactanivorans]
MILPETENRILKYLTNEASADDLDFLSDWILVSENESRFEAYVKIYFETMLAMNEPDTDKIKKKLLEEIKRDKRKTSGARFQNMLKYAAVAVLFLTIGYLYQIDFFGKKKNEALVPGEAQITITMDNGTVESLDPNRKGKVKDAKGNVVGNQDKGKLIYTGNPNSKELVYNTLHVPYGKRFDLVLSDGTRVFLNSGTTMRYPVTFHKDRDRTVFLEGEAYFEVTKDDGHPFVVNADEMNVKVLGTKFNVSHYLEDSSINTVLVEGAVELHNKGSLSGEAVPLEPGFKAEMNKGDTEISIEKVNTRVYTAWIQGKLIFRNSSFRQIRQTLERKYNIKIHNGNKNLDEQLFDATFDIESIDQILQSFSKSYAITYKIIDNEVIIE